MNEGLQLFLKALVKTLSESPLRAWYKKVLLRTLLVALVLVFSLGAAIIYGVASLFTDFWMSVGVGTLTFIALFFISGWLGILLVNFFVQFLGKERQLFQILIRTAIAIPANMMAAQSSSNSPWRFLASLLLSIGAIPLLIFPATLPIGVIVYAWVFASDALAGAGAPMPSHATRIGLGIVPAALSLFPMVGWAMLPVLQVAAQLYKLDTNKP